MFRIKICGITRPDDAIHAARAGADAIGLNFHHRSPRCISLETARQITHEAPPSLALVGVFVNASADEIRHISAELSLDYVQLHGDEPPQALADLAGLRLIRAQRLDEHGWSPLAAYHEQCAASGVAIDAYLIDAAAAGQFGGTGVQVDWQLAERYHDLGWNQPLILAGGLNPANVAAAIEAVRPAAVDVASGVESSPGIKDAEMVTRFVRAAREAFGVAE